MIPGDIEGVKNVSEHLFLARFHYKCADWNVLRLPGNRDAGPMKTADIVSFVTEEVGDVAVIKGDSNLSIEACLSELGHNGAVEGFTLYDVAKGGMIVATDNPFFYHFVIGEPHLHCFNSML